MRRPEGKSKNLNTLTIETKTNVLDVYNWACKLAREIDLNEPVMPKPSWIQLANRLRLTNGNLIKVVGPQGAGKSTLAYFIGEILKNSGKETLYRRMIKGQESFGYWQVDKWVEPYESSDGTKHHIVQNDRDWRWDQKAESADTIIVDLWDYSKTITKDIIKALDAVQDVWVYRCRNAETLKKPVPNIVVFLQKEALPLHFFLGKMTLFKLEPWQPQELVEFYKKRFNSSFPFSEEALFEIAVLSSGIFRKFKEHIAAVFERFYQSPADIENEKIISLEDVKQIITVEKIVSDMELTLCELWPRSRENRVLAVKILQFLREHGPTFQEELTDKFFAGNKMAASRVLNTLALHNFCKFSDHGRKRRWELG